jgi:hypothetical protein
VVISAGLTRAREVPADGERRRRPIDGLPRFGILAGGEFDEEAAGEIGDSWWVRVESGQRKTHPLPQGGTDSVMFHLDVAEENRAGRFRGLDERLTCLWCLFVVRA